MERSWRDTPTAVRPLQIRNLWMPSISVWCLSFFWSLRMDLWKFNCKMKEERSLKLH